MTDEVVVRAEESEEAPAEEGSVAVVEAEEPAAEAEAEEPAAEAEAEEPEAEAAE
jgi:hypothetical protein